MKFSLAYCLIILFVSCDSSEKKKVEDSSNSTEINKTRNEEKNTSKKNDLSLRQQGDYGSLFNLAKGDCSFVTPNDIAAALSLPVSAIRDDSTNGRCNYNVTLKDDSNWTVSLQWHSISKDKITKEIKNYIDEASPLIALISQTKDTYLCVHPFNKFLMIYNNSYDGTIQINYCKTAACRKLDKTEKEKRKELAIDISNHLLQKHKK